jgi:endoglucanase
MVADLAQPLAAAKRTGLPLYCGEFGVFIMTPQPARLAWYRDIASVFREYGIGWANWDYKGGFALVQDGKSTGIAEVLLAQQ